MAAQGSLEIGELTQFALDTVRNVGKEALRFYGKGNPRTKFDSDLVTAAELHLVDYFKDCLDIPGAAREFLARLRSLLHARDGRPLSRQGG